jgi:hypothetical protein
MLLIDKITEQSLLSILYGSIKKQHTKNKNKNKQTKKKQIKKQKQKKERKTNNKSKTTTKKVDHFVSFLLQEIPTN